MAVLALIAFAENDIVAPARAVQARAGFDWELLALITGLVVLIGIGVSVTLRLREQARSDDLPKMPEHSLAHYQDLLKRGLIDAQEFDRIRIALSQKPKTPPTKS